MPSRVELSVRLNGPQMRAHRALFTDSGQVRRRRTVAELFGRGVGKTFHARTCWWLIVAAFDGKLRTEAPEPFRGVRITSICPTLKQWKDINWSGIEQELGSRGKWGFLGAKLDRQSGLIRFPGGSRVQPFPATAHNAAHNRGLRTDVLDAEELDDIEATVYDSVAIPFLSEPWSLGIELLRGTPTRGRHGLWYRVLQNGQLGELLRSGQISEEAALRTRQAKAMVSIFEELPADEWPPDLPRNPEQAALALLRNYFAFKASYRDAPETVSPIAVARAKADMSEATFRREWESDPDAGEGMVYPFDERFHVREVPDGFSFNSYMVGVDHGYRDPGVFVLLGVFGAGETASAWVLDEIYQTERIPDWWLQQALKWDAATQPWSPWIRRALASELLYYCDPSNPAMIAALQRLGVRAIGAQNDIEAGISCVVNLMARRFVESSPHPFARFYVRPNCINTIRELGLYRRRKDPLNLGSYLEAPVDRDNHIPDAIRYACISRFGSGSSEKSERPR